jgi:DNA-binding LacI/PurR family transcriptional regulator
MGDVARLARCDVSTVSLALRNDPRITPATTNRVRAAAERLRYRVNPLVSAWVIARRAARAGPSRVTLAYLSSHPSGTRWGESPHFRSIFDGVKERAADFGYALEQFHLADYGPRLDALNRVLVTRAVRGLIIGPTLQPHTLTGIEWERFALVTVGYALTEPAVHRVTEDHHFGMKLAFEACVAEGQRRIGLAITGRHHELRRERWIGAFLAEQHLRLPARNRLPILLSDGQPDAIATWLAQARPEVVLADEPEKWARSGVPAVGFAISTADDRRGVHENNRGIGRSAAELLAALVQRNERGLPASRQTVLVEPEFER